MEGNRDEAIRAKQIAEKKELDNDIRGAEERNKNEAIIAKQIAERKLLDNDIRGAEVFGLKAQDLFPGLVGLANFLEVIRVYVASEKKRNGDPDLYGILGVHPSASEDEIRRHYRKKILTLHPDKNSSVGANGAFRIIFDAHAVLSNKDKRLEYDTKHNIGAPDPMVSAENPQTPVFYDFFSFSGSSSTSRTPSFHDFFNFPGSSNASATPSMPAQPRSTNFWDNPAPNFQETFSQYEFPPTSPEFHNIPSPIPPSCPLPDYGARLSEGRTFWTTCHHCLVVLKYPSIGLLKKLCCPKCLQLFIAWPITPRDDVISNAGLWFGPHPATTTWATETAILFW